MSDNNQMEKVGAAAQLATAVAALAYPIIKTATRYVDRRRERETRRLSEAAAVVEARLADRCSRLERRVVELEQLRQDAA